MFFVSKCSILLVLFGASFCLGFSENEKQRKGNSNNSLIDHNLNITTRANKCDWGGGCYHGLCWAYRHFKRGGLWCHTTKNGSGFQVCHYDSDCSTCWQCYD